jgi:hypothetical protein
MSKEEARRKNFESGELVVFPTSQLVKIPVDDSIENIELQITAGWAKIGTDLVEVGKDFVKARRVVPQGSEVLLGQDCTAQLVITRYTD